MGLFFAHFFVKLQSIIVYRSKYVTVYSGSGRENSKQYTIYLLFLVRFITSKRSKHQQFKINIYVMGRSSGILPKNVEFENNRVHHNILSYVNKFIQLQNLFDQNLPKISVYHSSSAASTFGNSVEKKTFRGEISNIFFKFSN